MLDLNICSAKIYWSKSSFPSKCDLKSDEDKNNHSFAPCEGMVKFRHILLVQLNSRVHRGREEEGGDEEEVLRSLRGGVGEG